MWAAVVLAFIGVLVLVANTGKLPHGFFGASSELWFLRSHQKRG